MSHRLGHRLIAPVLILIMTMAGCAGPGSTVSSGQEAAGAGPGESAGWPRTIDYPGGSVTLAASPNRVVAMSSDVADVALQLIGPERIAAVPKLNTNPNQSTQADLAGQVDGMLVSATGADPEVVLNFEPDLVLVTTRHDAESDAFSILEQAGVPILAITNKWADAETYVENVTLIARALGAEDQAATLIKDYQSRWQAVADATAGLSDDQRPLAAQLRVLGDKIYLSGPGSINHAVLGAAGARQVSDVLGMKKSQPATTEQLITAEPSDLVVLDSTGKGRGQYDVLFGSPGMAVVPAVADDRILVLPAAAMSSGSGGLGALEAIAHWLHPDLVPAP